MFWPSSKKVMGNTLATTLLMVCWCASYANFSLHQAQISFPCEHATCQTIAAMNYDELSKLIGIFLELLMDDGYQVLTYQSSLFACYEQLLERITCVHVGEAKPDFLLLCACALSKGANVYRRMGSQDSLNRALVYHQQALVIRKKYLQSDALELAHSFSYLGATYNELKGAENNGKAIECYNNALIIYEHNTDAGIPYIATTLYQLGNAYRDLNEKNTGIAIEYVNRALLLFSTLPLDNAIRREMGKALYNQAVNYHLCGGTDNIKQALQLLSDAKALFESVDDRARVALCLSYLANLYRVSGDFDQAIEQLYKALPIQEQLFGKEHVEIAKTFFFLGQVYLDLKTENSIEHAKSYLEQALILQKKLLAKDDPDITKTEYYLSLF